MRDGGELLECAEVHGNFYGTPREPVEKALPAGRDVLFDIDWQGTQQLYEKMRARRGQRVRAAAVRRRAEAAPGTRARRIHAGCHRAAADATPPRKSRTGTNTTTSLVNRDLDKSFARLRAILTAERLEARAAGRHLERFVDELLADLKTLDALSMRLGLSSHAPLERARQRDKALDWNVFGARGRFDAGRRRAAATDRGRATSGSAAASCGAGRRRPR